MASNKFVPKSTRLKMQAQEKLNASQGDENLHDGEYTDTLGVEEPFNGILDEFMK